MSLPSVWTRCHSTGSTTLFDQLSLSSAKPPNPLRLTLVRSVAYPRIALFQTHCAYLTCFQWFNLEKRPLFSGEQMESTYGLVRPWRTVLAGRSAGKEADRDALYPAPGAQASLRTELECGLESAACLEKLGSGSDPVRPGIAPPNANVNSPSYDPATRGLTFDYKWLGYSADH